MEKYSIDSKTSYILGVSLIVEALKEIPGEVCKVYLSSKANHNSELEKLLSLCNKHNVEVIYDDQIIQKLSLKENCYGIGVFRKYQKDLKTNRHLVLYKYDNEGELGTIIRSSVSFDFNDIVLIDSNVDIFNPKVIRASMGSFFHVNIKKYSSLEEYFSEYKYSIYPFTAKGSRELKTIKFTKPYSIIIPGSYNLLDGMFIDAYYLKHTNQDEISLTSLTTIVLNYAYHLNLKR